MKKVSGLLLSFSLGLICSVGCGGSGGGSVTEDAEQSAIEAYQEAERAEQEAMKDMQMDVE